MSIDRRSFVAAAAALAAAAATRPAKAAESASALIARGPDPLGVRADFPIVADCTYLNSAYIAPMVRRAAAAGAHFVEVKSKRPLLVSELLGNDNAVRAQFARLVNADPDEIGLLFSTGEGENLIAQGLDFAPGDNVVLSELCYPIPFVVYRALESARGVELRIAKHRDGVVDVRDFEPHVDRRTRVVSVAWVSHQNGFRHDMRAIADLAHAFGAVCYADAVQAVGMFPIDVRATMVDALCCGTYKWLLAGFGVAPFYITPALNDRLRLDRYGEFQIVRELPDHHFELENTARRFDYGTRAFGAVSELGASLSFLEKVDVARIETHSVGLAQRLHDGLVGQGHAMFTPPGNRSSIVSFYVTKPLDHVRATFHKANVEVTVREDPSRADATGYVRVGIGLFNTADEVDRCLEVANGLG